MTRRMAPGTNGEVRADPQQHVMIHLDRTAGPLMLDVTTAAILDVRVECCRLFAQSNSGSGMAGDASGRFDARVGV